MGAKPALFSPGGAGASQYAVVVSGGYTDPTDFPSGWITNSLQQYAIAVALNTATASAPLTEATAISPTTLKFKYSLGAAGEKGFSQAHVVGDEVYFTTDSGDVNAAAYGTSGATGKTYAVNFTGGSQTGSVFPTSTISGGASSIISRSGTLYTGGGQQVMKAGTAVAGSGTAVGINGSIGLTRKLWLRSE